MQRHNLAVRPFVLTVAGSDPSGGAGVQADIKTIAALGADAGAVIAGLTAQSDVCVYETFAVAPEAIAAQCQAIISDCRPAAVKTGMLSNADTVRAILPLLRFCADNDIPVVGDPVCVSTSGATLLDTEGRAAWVKDALPLYTLITPNRAEARWLSGEDDDRAAAAFLIEQGAAAALITGGDSATAADTVTDTLYSRSRITPRIYTSARIPGGELCRGTGCALSAAIACRLAFGDSPEDAIETARHTVQVMMQDAYSPDGAADRTRLGIPGG